MPVAHNIRVFFIAVPRIRSITAAWRCGMLRLASSVSQTFRHKTVVIETFVNGVPIMRVQRQCVLHITTRVFKYKSIFQCPKLIRTLRGANMEVSNIYTFIKSMKTSLSIPLYRLSKVSGSVTEGNWQGKQLTIKTESCMLWYANEPNININEWLVSYSKALKARSGVEEMHELRGQRADDLLDDKQLIDVTVTRQQRLAVTQLS